MSTTVLSLPRMPRDKAVPPLWKRPIADWQAYMTAAGRSSETISTRASHLAQLARAVDGIDPWTVTGDALLGWVSRQDWARETRRGMYHSIRQFWLWAMRDGRCTSSPAAVLPAVRAGAAMPRPVPDAALRRALLAADARETLILRLASEAGLRRAEVARVHSRDLLEDLTGWSVVVHGKGQKDRMLPLGDELAALVRAACETGGGWAFPGNDDGHLSPRYVGTLASRLLPVGWSLHTLRHRFATRMYGATHDLLLVQRALGHTSVATTQRYVQVPGDALRDAMTAIAA